MIAMTTRTLLAALLLVAVSVFAEPLVVSRSPFTIRIVDASTGEDVPGLRITTDNGIVCYTLLDGTAAWGEWSLMGRPVHFAIEDENGRFDRRDIILRATRGERTVLTVTAH
jgi:hypothetical protein